MKESDITKQLAQIIVNKINNKVEKDKKLSCKLGKLFWRTRVYSTKYR